MCQIGKIAVLGAGSWGTALAILLARNGNATKLWGHKVQHIESLRKKRENQKFLPGVPLPLTLSLDVEIESAIKEVEDVLVVVPSHAFRPVLQSIQPHLPEGVRLSWATKGLEQGSAKLLHEIAEEVLGPQWPTAVVSGPTFAMEVALDLPTAITVASTTPGVAEAIAERLHNERFRAYSGHDVVAVELGGALKNVLAIASGIADGLGFGANTRAALITRGLAEIIRLGIEMGGIGDSFMGLAGLGDLVLTCTDNQSRNRRLGLALARGVSVNQAKLEIGQEVEGIATAAEGWRLACRCGVDMPIIEQTYKVLHEGLSPQTSVLNLLGREQKAEGP